MPNRYIYKWWITLPIVFLISVGSVALGQKKQERPKVHADFNFGAFPYSSDAQDIFLDETAVQLIVGFHEGWSLEKFINETGLDRVDILTLADDLEDRRLIRGRNDYSMRPGFPVLRELELEILLPKISAHAQGLIEIIKGHRDELDHFVSSLDAPKGLPRKEILYQALVGGILLGGMIDAFYDDKTLMATLPRRARRGDRFYAWMTEGSRVPTQMIHQTRRIGQYQVVSLGTVLDKNIRFRIEDLRIEGLVYENEDARKWRAFTAIFSRDYLLPYFKSERRNLISLHEEIRASRYSALAEFVAWYYQSVVREAIEHLVLMGYIKPPEMSYKFAIQSRR